jgi:hypothetical protein
VSVKEPSNAVNSGMVKQTEERQIALRTSLRPQLELWLGLAWLGLGDSLKPLTQGGSSSVSCEQCYQE